MQRRHVSDLGPELSAGAVAISVLRSVMLVALVVVAYYLVPLDEELGVSAWTKFAVGLLAFTAFVVWQIRIILGSARPRLRALEAVAVGLPFLLVFFSASYVVIERSTPGSFSESLSRNDALYYTVTIFSTVGTGDIVPVTEGARMITMVQMVAGVIAVGVIAKVVVGAVQVATRRRGGRDTGDGGE